MTLSHMEQRTNDFDVLIRGGLVATMDPARRVLPADVLVQAGRIAAITPRGASGSARPKGRKVADASRPHVRVIEAGGAIVVPGFVQTHVHLCQALFRGMADELPLLDWLRRPHLAARGRARRREPRRERGARHRRDDACGHHDDPRHGHGAPPGRRVRDAREEPPPRGLGQGR
jgi:cytosine/adenosine deaminase-related metal-dependent hydrolase